MPPTHRTFFPHKTVYVLSTGIQKEGRIMAEVMDAQTRTTFMLPWVGPNRLLPQPGDIWRLGQDTGAWSFQTLLRPGKVPRLRRFSRVLGLLEDLGLIVYRPEDGSDDDARETPHLAYVGEVRLFFGPLPEGWLECDGGEVGRAQEALLFSVLGTTQGVGDGTTTYNLPTIAPVGDAVHAVCAR